MKYDDIHISLNIHKGILFGLNNPAFIHVPACLRMRGEDLTQTEARDDGWICPWPPRGSRLFSQVLQWVKHRLRYCSESF